MFPCNFEVALCRRPRIFSTCHLWKCRYRAHVYWNLWYQLLSILKVIFLESNPLQFQGSPHIVKTGPLSWLKDEVRENLGDFRKSIQISTFLSPLPHVPLPFTKRTCCTMILKKDAINEFGIKYWTSNTVWVKFREHVNIEEKVWLLVKKIRTWKDWQGRNWAISLKPRRRSHPLRLVWWALGL